VALSQSDIQTLASGAGLSAARAKVAAAIAMAESGGNPAARNDKGRDDSYGLWQINMKGALGPERRRKLGLTSDSQLLDPVTNARAMAVISSRGGNFSPWSTYTNGAYRKYLDGAAGGGDVVNAGFNIPGVDIPDFMAPFKQFGHLVDAVDKTAAWISNSENWVRILYVIGGIVMVDIAIVLLIKDSAAGKAATRTAKTALKVAT
jgi:hypothetical protein